MLPRAESWWAGALAWLSLFGTAAYQLLWMSARMSNETGFVVERAPTGSGTWTQVGTTAANATSLTDTAVAALAPGTFDYRVGATRVVCNPRGYLPYQPNPAFDPALVVTIP